MDITLERILSLLPKNETGKYIRGAKKDFAESLNLAHNIIPEWVKGKNKSYNNYLYEIAAKYHVSVEWLKGETDEKTPADNFLPSAEQLDREFIDLLLQLTDDEIKIAVAYIKGMIANRK